MRVAEGSRHTKRRRNILGKKWKNLKCHNLEIGNWKQFPFFCRKFFLDRSAVLWYNRPSVGEKIGLAFQLQDDFLDVYGDTKVFGKAIGGDIVSNKKTYMLINAFLRADEEQKAELTRWVEAKEFDEQEKIAAVTRLYNAIGIDRLAEQKIESFFNEGLKCLDAVSINADRKQMLVEYVYKLMKRKY